jgi:hypothetical protein
MLFPLFVVLGAGCAPPECSAGVFVEADQVQTCFGARTLGLPLSVEAKALFEQKLGPLGVDLAALSSEYYLRPRSTDSSPNARALFKPRRGATGRVPLIELNEAFDTVRDDGALVMALVHEYGHIAQYLRGEPAGDELEARLCSPTKLSDGACDSVLTAHLAKMERDADAFMVASIRQWSPSKVDFDPWALVDLIEANEPGPTYPPNDERVAPIAAALGDVGLRRGAARTSKALLEALPGLAAPAAAALDRQGGVPR